jgi:hypothetical protein
MQIEHLAASAWRELRRKRATPVRLEVLGQGAGVSAVYRLVGVEEGLPTVIAKRCPQRTALIERTVYEEILPKLPLPTLQYYGFVEETGSDFAWLFLEDVSEHKYQPHLREHRIAAAHWLSAMNVSAATIEAAAALPERGAKYYLNLLNRACAVIQANIANPALDRDGLNLLESIFDLCQQVAANWVALEDVCEGMPLTLVHGDFISKNVGVRNGGDGIVILPFDWEKAGWGIPAEDISGVDIPTYWRVVQRFWPQYAIDDFTRLAQVGRVFRWLVFLEWIAPAFAGEAVEQPMRDLRYYADWLIADLEAAAKWRDEASVRAK